MEPVDYRALKEASHDIVEPQQRSAGWTAVVFFLILNLATIALNLASARFAPLPEFETTDELLQYFLNGHTEDLLRVLAFELATLGVSLLFTGIFSAYCLKITHGKRADQKTLLGCTDLIFRYLLLFILLLAAIFVISMVFSLIVALAPPFAMIFSALLAVGAVIAFYALRLVLFAVADREDANVLSAVRDCARRTKGHRMELFFLDISFLWFVLLIFLITSFLSFLPDAAFNLASTAGKTALTTWLTANYDMLSLGCSVAGVLAVLPLVYKFYTKIRVTYALVWQRLKQQPAQQEETQPLAYMEFPDSQQ